MRTPLLLTLSLVACGGTAPTDATVATTSAGAEAGPAEGQYSILLSRPSRVGETYREHIVHRRARGRRVTVNGAVAEETAEELELEMVSTVRVLAVASNGATTLLEHHVESCVLRDANGERAVVPPGGVLRVTRVAGIAGEGAIELVGEALGQETTELLDMVISTTYSPRGDDGIFGSATPRRVGESWAIDRAAAAQDLNKIPSIRVREDQLSGSTTLHAVEEIDGVPCLVIQAELTAANIDMPNAPEGTTLESAQIQARMGGAFPVDEHLGRLREVEELVMDVRMRIPRPEGGDAIMEVRSADLEIVEIAR